MILLVGAAAVVEAGLGEAVFVAGVACRFLRPAGPIYQFARDFKAGKSATTSGNSCSGWRHSCWRH